THFHQALLCQLFAGSSAFLHARLRLRWRESICLPSFEQHLGRHSCGICLSCCVGANWKPNCFSRCVSPVHCSSCARGGDRVGCQSQGSGCGSFRSTFVPCISSIPPRRSKRALVVHLFACAVPGCGRGKAFSRGFSGRVCGTRSLCGETFASPFATGQSAICHRCCSVRSHSIFSATDHRASSDAICHV